MTSPDLPDPQPAGDRMWAAYALLVVSGVLWTIGLIVDQIMGLGDRGVLDPLSWLIVMARVSTALALVNTSGVRLVSYALFWAVEFCLGAWLMLQTLFPSSAPPEHYRLTYAALGILTIVGNLLMWLIMRRRPLGSLAYALTLAAVLACCWCHQRLGGPRARASGRIPSLTRSP